MTTHSIKTELIGSLTSHGPLTPGPLRPESMDIVYAFKTRDTRLFAKLSCLATAFKIRTGLRKGVLRAENKGGWLML